MTDPRIRDTIIPLKPRLPVVDRVQGFDLSLGIDPFDDDERHCAAWPSRGELRR